MKWRELFKDWRIWLLILALIISVVGIFPHYETNQAGEVFITTNIGYGIEITGGSEVMIGSKKNKTEINNFSRKLDKVEDILDYRINSFGLKDTETRKIGDEFIQAKVAEANLTQLKDLITRGGNLEARIKIPVKGDDTLTFGKEAQKEFSVELKDENLSVEGKEYQVNDTFELEIKQGKEISLKYESYQENQGNLSALVFEGKEVKNIKPRSARATGVSGRSYRLGLLISNTAARRMTDISQTFDKETKIIRGEKEAYLKGAKLKFFLGNKLAGDPLDIAYTFKRQEVKNPTISGTAGSEEKANEELNKLDAILRSASYPFEIKIINERTFSGTLGSGFVTTALVSIFAAVIAVAIVVLIRYQRPEVALPITMTGLSEVLIILGVASLINWSINLPSIAGIIAAVGTGVDDQVVLTDESKDKKIKSLKVKIERAFFIIFTAAASTIGAMLPLYSVGAGAVRGFALTTIIGILIGITITRPAYAAVLEHMK